MKGGTLTVKALLLTCLPLIIILTSTATLANNNKRHPIDVFGDVAYAPIDIITDHYLKRLGNETRASDSIAAGNDRTMMIYEVPVKDTIRVERHNMPGPGTTIYRRNWR